MRHQLVDGMLEGTDKGIIGRCKCGWTTGYRFSSFAASVAFRNHQESISDRDPVHGAAAAQPEDGAGA